jgi:hypothetical protein
MYPVTIVNYDSISRGQVNPETPSSSRQEENRNTSGIVEAINLLLSVTQIYTAINTTKSIEKIETSKMK